MTRTTNHSPVAFAGTPRRVDSVRSLRRGVTRGVGLALCACLLAAPTWAWDRKQDRPRQIRVIGQAEVSAAPDRVSLDVGVLTRADSAKAAADQNAADTRAVVEKLRSAFPDTAEVSTSGYALMPEYEYDKREGKRRPAGFSARNTVHVVLSDVEAAGALIDAAVGSGANDVRAVQFGVADASELERAALVAAVADAQAKAETIAASLDAKLGHTIRVEEGGTSHAPSPRLYMARAEADSTPIEPSDVFFEARVSLWVELLDK